MRDILTSIIIPCFNAEKHVGDAIRSALAQTYQSVEVIVVDDGSTDASLRIVQAFGGRVRWTTGPNRGGGAARNLGVAMARGEIIQFLDADDFLAPDKLERQIPVVLQNKDKLVYCQYKVEGAPSHGAGVMKAPAYSGGDPVVFAVNAKGLQTSSPLHSRRNLQAVNGFREHLPCSQERDLHIRLACYGLGFVYMPDVLYTVRRLEGSVSANTLRVLDQHGEIVWNAYRILEQAGTLTDERKAAFAGLLASDARAYLNHSHVEKAHNYFDQAAKIHPAGGIPQAYRRPARWLHRLLGPEITQRVVCFKRSISSG